LIRFIDSEYLHLTDDSIAQPPMILVLLYFISSRGLSRDLFSTGGKWKFVIFEVFRAYLREF